MASKGRAVSVRLTDWELSVLDRWSNELSLSRSEILRSIIGTGLAGAAALISNEVTAISRSDFERLMNESARYDRLMSAIEKVLIEEASHDHAEPAITPVDDSG